MPTPSTRQPWLARSRHFESPRVAVALRHRRRPLAARSARAVSAAADAALEEIVVTATRKAAPSLRTPLSIGRIGAADVLLVGSTHHSEILNRVAGTMIQRGSGQESLTAIRSPVLTGAGSCGAFLFLENSVPIRPVGFCNVNELFEVNTEQADSIEVLRGPGDRAVRLERRARHRQRRAGRARAIVPQSRAASKAVRTSTAARSLPVARSASEHDFGVKARYTHDGGWRDDSGFDEAKLNATLVTSIADHASRFDLAATDLDQETAGSSSAKARTATTTSRAAIPNPEAYRDAHAVRLTGLIEGRRGLGAQLEFRPYLRSSRMEFLQHFLLGKPLERNGQESARPDEPGALVRMPTRGRCTAGSISSTPIRSWSRTRTGRRPTARRPPMRSARPACTTTTTCARRSPRSTAGRATLARALAGIRRACARNTSTTTTTTACSPATRTRTACRAAGPGCLYTPSRRSQRRLPQRRAEALGFATTWRRNAVAYLSLSRGFRPPEITELYRLQRGQQVADLDSERLDAHRARHQGAVRDAGGLARRVRHGQEGRHPARFAVVSMSATAARHTGESSTS